MLVLMSPFSSHKLLLLIFRYFLFDQYILKKIAIRIMSCLDSTSAQILQEYSSIYSTGIRLVQT